MTPRKTETTTTTQASTPNTADALAGIAFAPEPKPKAKADPNRPRCTNDGCQLFPAKEHANGLCINHQPAERRLTRAEATLLSTRIEAMTPAERLILVVRALGWHTSQQWARDVEATGHPLAD